MLTNETKLDLDLNLKLNEHITIKKSRSTIFTSSIVIFICGLLVLLLDVFVPEGEPLNLTFPIICFVLSITFLILGLCLKQISKASIKKLMQGKTGNNKYTFDENEYKIESVLIDGTTSTTNGNYMGLTEVREFDDMWVLFINKSTMLPVAKDGMTSGTIDELTAFLKQKLGVQYKTFVKTK